MPEGHTLHRLARELGGTFGGRVVRVSSPQGRFAEAAALLDGKPMLVSLDQELDIQETLLRASLML